MKTNRELAIEVVNHVKEEMKNTMIYEVECHSNLQFGRFVEVVAMVKEILSAEYFVGDSKDNNLLVWERNEKVNQYVMDNLL